MLACCIGRVSYSPAIGHTGCPGRATDHNLNRLVLQSDGQYDLIEGWATKSVSEKKVERTPRWRNQMGREGRSPTGSCRLSQVIDLLEAQEIGVEKPGQNRIQVGHARIARRDQRG